MHTIDSGRIPARFKGDGAEHGAEAKEESTRKDRRLAVPDPSLATGISLPHDERPDQPVVRMARVRATGQRTAYTDPCQSRTRPEGSR